MSDKGETSKIGWTRNKLRRKTHEIWAHVDQQDGGGVPAAGGSYQSPHEQPEHLTELSHDLAPAGNSASNYVAVSSDRGSIVDDIEQTRSCEILEGLPAEIKIVVQEKQKFLSTTKRPIIMPSMSEELPKPVEGKPTTFFSQPTFETIPTKISKPNENAPTKQQMNRQPKHTIAQKTNKPNLVNIAVHRQPVKQQSQITNVGPKQIAVRVRDKVFSNHPGSVPMRFPSGIPRSFLIHQQNTPQQWLDSSFQSGADWTDADAWPGAGPGEGAGPGMAAGLGTGAGCAGMSTGAGCAGMSTGAGCAGMSTGAGCAGMSTGAVEPPAFDPALYSPNEHYASVDITTQEVVSPPEQQASNNRLSAFQRLGPQQENKSKLIINLHQNKDTPVRQVVRPVTVEPVESRACVLQSTDPVVREYRPHWPWRRAVGTTRHVTHRHSKSVMILEQEQMEVHYDSDQRFILITVAGYPVSWCKEQVLDVLLDKLKGKTFIPFFINFTAEECKFFVLRNRSALIAIHKLCFQIHKDDVTLNITISLPDLTVNNIQFIPRLVLRRILTQGYDGELSLSLKEFTLKPDLSNFIYFPLSRESNQLELLQLQSDVAWEYLTHLDLSHNRITSLEGFDLAYTTPKLKHLNLSHNCIESVRALVASRNLPLTSLQLHANPLCRDYTDAAAYASVLRMLFPALRHVDGVAIHRGGIPASVRAGGVCSAAGAALAATSVRRHARLLARRAARPLLRRLYHAHAALSVSHTCTRGTPGGAALWRCGRTLGAAGVLRLLMRWPELQHDYDSFTLDLLYHSDSTTIYRVSGLMKVTSESLAEDEHLLWFTRSVVLTTDDGTEYRIRHEMVTWSEPTDACAEAAFHVVHTDPKPISLVLDSAPDEDLKEKLIIILMKLSTLDKPQSEKCLEKHNWNLKTALEYFIKLLKLNDLDALKT